MKNRWSLKGQNKGASLLAVLVALIFVGIIGIIILDITIANIQMREIEESGKKNFYTAEVVMDDLTAGLNNIAASAMENAYTAVLKDYRTIMVTGTDIQDSFTRLYMDELQNVFWDGDNVSRKDRKKTYNPGNVEKLVYVIGKYKEQPLLDSMTAYQSCLKFDPNTATYKLDYEEGLFTLENVKIIYTDTNGYETSVKTDMVFHTPVLNFDGSNMIMDYMKYALIADDMIEISASNIMVDGNVYAGVGGVTSIFPGSASISGSTIVTRGDIEVGAGTNITIGDGTSRIWAENVETTGKGSASSLVLNGNCYIADDLTLNGKNSTVTLYGNYYGYNFQDKYDAVRSTTDASFSSAMMVNAKECRLDLSNLNYLLLSGRTYISRGSKENIQNNDIMLGESISVRSNQLAYYVPVAYLDVTDESNIRFTTEGETAYEDSIGFLAGGIDISGFLNSSKPIATYCFNDGVNTAKRYYLNFASEQKANDFFAAYYNANSGVTNANAANYIGNKDITDNNGIILDNGTLFTLKGDIMYMDGDRQPIQEKKVTISGNDWESGAGGAAKGIYWDLADRMAVNYKSLQLYLEDSHVGVTTDNVRFEDGTGKIDKSITPLMNNLLDVSAIEHDYPVVGGVSAKKEKVVIDSPTDKRVVVVVHNKGREQYEVDEKFREGIIIATGDVYVKKNFTGMIIAGGKISFATGVNISSDELMVSQLFKEDIATGTPVFAQYFTDYGTLSTSVIGVVQIDEYLTYDNWTKNDE